MMEKNEPINVPYIVHEGMLARQERTIKRLFIALGVVIVLRDGYSRGNSYARRRRRDSRGRYASEGYSGRRGYSRDDDMISELRGLMEEAPDEQTKMEFQRLISKMENM